MYRWSAMWDQNEVVHCTACFHNPIGFNCFAMETISECSPFSVYIQLENKISTKKCGKWLHCRIRQFNSLMTTCNVNYRLMTLGHAFQTCLFLIRYSCTLSIFKSYKEWIQLGFWFMLQCNKNGSHIYTIQCMEEEEEQSNQKMGIIAWMF